MGGSRCHHGSCDSVMPTDKRPFQRFIQPHRWIPRDGGPITHLPRQPSSPVPRALSGIGRSPLGELPLGTLLILVWPSKSCRTTGSLSPSGIQAVHDGILNSGNTAKQANALQEEFYKGLFKPEKDFS